MGLAPYGAGRAGATVTTTDGLRLREAMRTTSFWGLAGTIFFAGIPCYSFNKHILVFLQELGWEPVAAADMKSLFFAISSVTRFSFGWLCDRFDKRRVVLLHLLCLAAGYPLILLVAEHPAVLVPCLVVVGIGYGGLLPTIPIMTVHLFGRAHLGKILGVYKWPYDVAAAAAPLLTAWLYDLSGGYDVPERVNAALAWVGLAIAALFLARRVRGAGSGTTSTSP
jgi:MFS family permease